MKIVLTACSVLEYVDPNNKGRKSRDIAPLNKIKATVLLHIMAKVYVQTLVLKAYTWFWRN